YLPVELVNAIDFSRYYRKERMTDKTLVIVVSISGNGFRIKEITKKANACGALTLAVTKNKDSDIGNRAKKVLLLPLSPFEGGPGNRTYFSSLLALLLFGIAMGERRGVHDEAKSQFYYEEIKRQGELLIEYLPTWEEPLFQLAKDWREMTGFDFVGSGMEYGSAFFSHAKILEITGAFAMQINSEEWFHMNNFVKDIDKCGTIFIASVKAPGYDRTKEAVCYSVRLGRPTLVITDGTEEDLGVKVPCIQVPSASFLPAMALTQYVPVCILAGYMGAMLGEKNCRGCLGPWSFAAGGAFIKEKKEL
ncbi:MAG: SIS domain-containing protein, partial [Lachnospiraceae bacterium]|nr:SIS domain-containing protein [Lachnospiraceae bacterium]